jgi:hypothetical protein
VLVNVVVQESREKKPLENPGGDKIMADLGGAKSGLPFFAFVDKNGRKIADSNAMPNGSNIGYPAAPEEIKAFAVLLQKTAPRMTSKERDQVTDYLTKNAPRPAAAPAHAP